MGRTRKVVCEDCGGWARDVGRISLQGLCGGCGDRRSIEAREQLQAHEGPFWDRYLIGVANAAAKTAAQRKTSSPS